MSDWRTMMRDSFSPTQYPHNPQNRPGSAHSEDCEDIERTAKKLNPPKIASNPTAPVVDWRAEWRRLHELTHGLEPDDLRLPAILQTLDRCDTAFLSGDVAAFRDAARQVEQILTEQPPQSRQASPEPPLRPGWMIAYRDRRNRLQDGTVEHCALTRSVHLTTGQTIPLPWVRSVRKTDAEGKVIAAWDTRAHGYDGEGKGRS